MRGTCGSTDALEVVLGDLRGGLEVEGLFRCEIVEEDLLDGGLAAPARGREMRDGTELGDGSADLRMPSRRIFVLARSSPLGSVGRERAVAMAGARGGKRGRGRRGMTRTAGSARETRCAREQTRRGRARGGDRGAGKGREDGRGLARDDRGVGGRSEDEQIGNGTD